MGAIKGQDFKVTQIIHMAENLVYLFYKQSINTAKKKDYIYPTYKYTQHARVCKYALIMYIYFTNTFTYANRKT